MNNTWAPEMQQGGQFIKSVYKKILTVELVGSTVLWQPSRFVLPGFEATAEFPDERWLFSLTSSFSFDQNASANSNRVTLGLWRGADPPANPSSNDPRALTKSLYTIDSTTEAPRMITQWQDSVWVTPKRVGLRETFSMYFDWSESTGDVGLRIYPNTARFTLERYRTGPYFKEQNLLETMTLVST